MHPNSSQNIRQPGRQQKGHGYREYDFIQMTNDCQNGKWIFGNNNECHANLKLCIKSNNGQVPNVTLCFNCSDSNAHSNLNQNPHQTHSKNQPKVNLISKPKQKSDKQKARDNVRKSQYEFRKFCARQLPFSSLGSKAFASTVNVNNSLKQELTALKAKQQVFSLDKNQASIDIIKTSEDLTEAKENIENQTLEIISLKLKLEQNNVNTKDLTEANQTIKNQNEEIQYLKSELKTHIELGKLIREQDNQIMLENSELEERIIKIHSAYEDNYHQLLQVNRENENLRRENENLSRENNDLIQSQNLRSGYARRGQSRNNRRY